MRERCYTVDVTEHCMGHESAHANGRMHADGRVH